MAPPDLSRLLDEAMTEALRERGHVNVLIAGRTGVGKSTLINAVFQGDYVRTGQGRPVTRTTREVTKEGVPLTIFDTRGLELDAFEDTLEELETLVVDRGRERDPNRHLHVAWLCIQEPGRRVERAEIALHTLLARHMPVIAVITKASSDGGFRDEVQRLLPEARNVVRVRAIADELDDGHVLPPMGLEPLVELTLECVPEGHRRAFIAAQRASLKAKVRASHRLVAAAAASAAGVAAAPVPFADAAVLVPVQVGMLAGISATFGLELSTGFLSTLMSSLLGSTAATLGGRALVSNLLKFIPGAGSLAGGAIAATTAATITTAMGEAYIGTLAVLFERGEGEAPTPAEVAAAVRRQISGPEDEGGSTLPA